MSNIARIACLSTALITLSAGHGFGRDLIRQFSVPLCAENAMPQGECPPPDDDAELRMVQLQSSVSEREQLIQLNKRLVEGQGSCEICQNIR